MPSHPRIPQEIFAQLPIRGQFLELPPRPDYYQAGDGGPALLTPAEIDAEQRRHACPPCARCLPLLPVTPSASPCQSPAVARFGILAVSAPRGCTAAPPFACDVHSADESASDSDNDVEWQTQHDAHDGENSSPGTSDADDNGSEGVHGEGERQGLLACDSSSDEDEGLLGGGL